MLRIVSVKDRSIIELLYVLDRKAFGMSFNQRLRQEITLSHPALGGAALSLNTAPLHEACSSNSAPAKVRARPKAKSRATYSNWSGYF